MLEPTTPNEEPQRDFTKMLDLDRSTLINNFVDRIEQAMREIDNASEDLKQIVAEAKEHEFAPKTIAAMKAVAKLRLKDKAADAREKLEALERVSRAVKFDLFSWSEDLADR